MAATNTTWEPEQFANLNRLIEQGIEGGADRDNTSTFDQLKKQLDKLKPDLAGLFEYPDKNATHQSELSKGTPSINGEKFKVSDDFITEAKKLSDFLDIDEYIASALIHKAGSYKKRYELGAAESGVLLFYSDREAKLMCLSSLLSGGANQAIDASVRVMLEEFIGDLLSSTLETTSKMFPERILATMASLKTKQEKIAGLLNGPTTDLPYQREVVEYVQTKLGNERKQLAMVLFGIVRDYQLNSNELLALVEWLRNSQVDDPATLRLTIALLTALGTAAEGENPELAEVSALDKISHLVRDSQFLVKLNAEIVDEPWNDDGMKGLVWLQWALLALYGMKRSPGFDQLIGYREDKVERIAEQAIQMGAYRFAVDYLLGYRITDNLDFELSAEFEVLQKQLVKKPTAVASKNQKEDEKNKTISNSRYPHFYDIPVDFQCLIEKTLEDTISVFIMRMSSLIRRVRYNEEDAIYQAQQAELQRVAQEEEQQQQQQQQQLQQGGGGYRFSRTINNTKSTKEVSMPPEPRRDTEALFLWITVLFADRPDAGLKFWGSNKPATATTRGGGKNHIELDDRLAVFLRWGSDCREQGMIRGYFNMLSSLACGTQASGCAFEFMSGSLAGNRLMSPSRNQVASNQAPLCSWPALFGAIDFYAKQMRQNEPDPLVAAPEIPDAEVSLLQALLRLCRTVVRYSIIARSALYDSNEFSAVPTMFSLLGCVVPVGLKASLLSTIGAFGEMSEEVANSEGAQAENMRQAVHEIARRNWVLLEQSQTLPTTSDAEAIRQGKRSGNIGSMNVGRGYQNRGGIAYEVEEVEAAAETYPEMRAFVRMIGALIHLSSTVPAIDDMERSPVHFSAPSPSIPRDLGEAYRVPGITPYVGFVMDNVLLKAGQRAYRYESEKWNVHALSLEVLERSLATMDINSLLSGGLDGYSRPTPPSQQQQLGGGSKPSATTTRTDKLRELVTHPGFEIAVRILCGSKLLDTLLNILNVGVDELNSAVGESGRMMGYSVLCTLRILLRVLRMQDTILRVIVPELMESTETLGFPLNLPRSMTNLEQLLLARRQSVVQIITYVNGVVSTDVCLASIKILHILSESVVFNNIDDSVSRGYGMLTLNRLVSIIDRSPESVRIMHGFISCLEMDGDGNSEEDSSANGQVMDAAKGFTSGLDDRPVTMSSQSIRMAIIDLLLANLAPSKPAPTIAHYLLGFSLTKPTSTDLPDPTQRVTCLHTVMDLLRRDRQAQDQFDSGHSAAFLLGQRPRVSERCYQLVYRLCADPVTSEMTMRYLRVHENFFYNQISSIPAAIVPDVLDISNGNIEEDDPLLYNAGRVYAQMHARAWLWRSAALELHTLVLQDSRSRARQLAEWLVGDAGQQLLEGGTHPRSFLNTRMRVLALFDGLRQAYRDASANLIRQKHAAEKTYLSWSVFGGDSDDGEAMDTSLNGTSNEAAEAAAAELLCVDVGSTLVTNSRGCQVYELHVLVALLHRAEQALEANGALGSADARQRVHEAVRRIVLGCYFGNQERELYFAYACAMRGWKELMEVMSSSAWEQSESNSRESRERTAFQMLRGVVCVVAESDPVFDQTGSLGSVGNGPVWWIEPPTAAQELRHAEQLTALTPTVALLAERLSHEWTRSDVLSRASLPATNKPGGSGQGRQLPAPTSDSKLSSESLLEVWKLLVTSALTPAAQSSLQLRGNVYAAMLHFLGGLRKLAATEAESTTFTTNMISGGSRNRLVAGALDILGDSSLGERLLETASADAADASDAWKTVALSLLDALAALYGHENRPNRVVQFLARKNFFSALVGAILRREDQALQAILKTDPASLNALYIYEAKMAFFLRLAQRQEGAERLLESGILEVLTECSFLDQKPSGNSTDIGLVDAFIPAQAERFHQLLMPALDLVLALVAHIGRDHMTLWNKVARFVSQHYAVLESVLKETAMPSHPLSISLLTEAKAVTSLVFYIARNRAVLDRESSLASSGIVGIASMNLSMLALLPKLAANSNNWSKRLMATNDVERAQAQVSVQALGDDFKDEDSNSATSTGGEPSGMVGSVLGYQAGDLVDGVIQSVLAYAQVVTEQRQLSPSTFRPAFAWEIEHNRESDYTPSLATLVAFVKSTQSTIGYRRKLRDEKIRLSRNASEMATADLRKLIARSPYVDLSDNLGTPQMRILASTLLTQQAQRVSRSIIMQVSALEQGLVLLWRHLAYYAASSMDSQQPVTMPSSGTNGLPTAQERDILRSDASITLPPLLTSLSEMNLSSDEFASAATHTSFLQMLIRRIKDLVLRDLSIA